jgi:hypothetical protein
MSETQGDITRLLHEWRGGSPGAENQLFDLVVPDLQRLAHYLMQRERKGHTLQPPNSSIKSTSAWWRPRTKIGGTGAIFSL